MRIGFIGLGNMGGPMAANLIAAGHALTVSDLDRGKAEPLLAQGAAWAQTAGAAAEGAEIVMTSLPGPKQIEAVALAEDGLIARMQPGAVWIDLSTNNLAVWRRVAAAAAARDIATLDAPVTGGTEGAAAGTLVLLVGGEKETFGRCRPVFEAIGSRAEHLGPAGAGYVAKIAQVVLCYVHSLALSEALMLGVKGGIDAAKMLAIIQKSTGRSYVADRYGPAILRGDYDPSFALGLAEKDMALTLELAEAVDASLPLCELTRNIYAEARAAYGDEVNHLMAVRILEDANRVLLRSHDESEGADATRPSAIRETA